MSQVTLMLKWPIISFKVIGCTAVFEAMALSVCLDEITETTAAVSTPGGIL